MRASTLKNVYTLKSDDPKEQMRVKSLQLLCFKLATHKAQIMQMLDKYHAFYRQASPANIKTDMVPFDQFPAMMKDFSLLVGVVFI